MSITKMNSDKKSLFIEDKVNLNTNYSDLVSKYMIIPVNILTIKLNVLEIDDKYILINLVCFIFKSFFERTNYNKINVINFKNFIIDVYENYNNVMYHNFYHATHILNTTYVLINECELFGKVNNDILFSMLIGALVHDIGHPGHNNLFEINTCSELACKYNDLSVLEQYHCNIAFELIKKNNLFEYFTHDEFIICRKNIIGCILGTDLANHKNLIEILKLKNTNGFNMELLEDQYIISEILVHAADISNPIHENSLCKQWGERISLEFHNQIEKEKERKLKPFSSFNINNACSFYSHEIKYITYLSKPFWEILSNIFINLKPYYDQINRNLEIYNQKLLEVNNDFTNNIK